MKAQQELACYTVGVLTQSQTSCCTTVLKDEIVSDQQFNDCYLVSDVQWRNTMQGQRSAVRLFTTFKDGVLGFNLFDEVGCKRETQKADSTCWEACC